MGLQEVDFMTLGRGATLTTVGKGVASVVCEVHKVCLSVLYKDWVVLSGVEEKGFCSS